MRSAPRHPRGFALLIVLWSVVLLSLLATGITSAGRTEVQLASNIRRAAAAQAAADAGVAAAVFHATDAPGQAWPADGRPHQMPFGAYTVTIRIADEDRKVNPNLAPPDLMAALLGASGVDPSAAASLAQSIAAWHMSSGHEQLDAQYQAAGRTAGPSGVPFRSVDDLGLVIGMTPQVLARLRPFLSVYAATPLDGDQADPVVRDALRSLGTVATAAPSPPTVIEITSDAQARDGSRFIRRAVVQLGQDEVGRPFRTLAWEAQAGP